MQTHSSSAARPASAQKIEEAARILADARRSATQLVALPGSCRPDDIESALAIQARVTALLGETGAGWKCGLPNGGNVVVASLHAGSVQRGSLIQMRTVDGMARVEPELAFMLGQDLPARSRPYSQEEMRAAIGETRLALELIGSRFVDHGDVSFPELLADGLVNQGLYLGPVVPDALAREWGSFPLTLGFADGSTRQVVGTHPEGDPLLPYYWLLGFLNERGVDLNAGMVIITGSYAGVVELPVNMPFTIRYGDLGSLSARIESRVPGLIG